MEFRDSSNAATLSARTQCHQCHLHFLKSQKLFRRLSFRESITEKKQILLAHMRKKLKTSTSWISHISEAPRLSLRIDGTPKIGAKCDFLPPLGILLEPRRPWLPWLPGMGSGEAATWRPQIIRCPGHSMRWGHSTSLWDPPGIALWRPQTKTFGARMGWWLGTMNF